MAGQEQHDGLALWFRGLLDWARSTAKTEQYPEDIYVPGGTNWDSYGLKSLVKMVAVDASPPQLEGLANRWRANGENIVQGSDDLQRSLTTLMQYWSGDAADQATVTVARNANWLTNLGETTTQMAEPIDDSAGALRSAQETMPGVPHNSWLAGAGGGAAAGFMIAGPFGAAAGAAFGAIASFFGFGSKKRKMKRKAVQTMRRFETAAVGIDGRTPQYHRPANGVMPGDQGWWSHNPVIPGSPTAPTAPGADNPPIRVTPPGDQTSGIPGTTTPSFVDNPPGRWTGITGGNWGPGANGGVGPGGLGPGGSGGFNPGSGPWARGGAGMPMGPGMMGGRGMGPGAGAMERYGNKFGRGMGPGAFGRGMGTQSDQERLSRYGSALGAAEEERAGGRFGRGAGGALGERGGYGGGYGAGAGTRKEDDGEHHRKFPYEEDPFLGDLKAAPPVIGL